MLQVFCISQPRHVISFKLLVYKDVTVIIKIDTKWKPVASTQASYLHYEQTTSIIYLFPVLDILFTSTKWQCYFPKIDKIAGVIFPSKWGGGNANISTYSLRREFDYGLMLHRPLKTYIRKLALYIAMSMSKFITQIRWKWLEILSFCYEWDCRPPQTLLDLTTPIFVLLTLQYLLINA